MRKQLIENNLNLVYHIVHKYYPTYTRDEDIIQCGMVGLCKAADEWDESKSQFSTFAGICILNEIRNEFRKRIKHQEVLSLDYEVDDEDGGRTSFGNLIVGDENIDYIDFSPKSDLLTEREKTVYKLICDGLNCTEIGKKLGISEQAVNKVKRRIIKRIRSKNGS